MTSELRRPQRFRKCTCMIGCQPNFRKRYTLSRHAPLIGRSYLAETIWTSLCRESICCSSVKSHLGGWFLWRSMTAGVEHAGRCADSTAEPVRIAWTISTAKILRLSSRPRRSTTANFRSWTPKSHDGGMHWKQTSIPKANTHQEVFLLRLAPPTKRQTIGSVCLHEEKGVCDDRRRRRARRGRED